MIRELEMQEMDWTALANPSEEMQRSWLLQSTTLKMKTYVQKKKTYAWTLAFIGVLVVIAFTMMTIRALTHLDHYQQQPPETYSIALHTGLKFFNSQRSGRLPEENNVTWRGDSCIQDGKYPGSSYPHLSGGYYDGGNAIKSNFKMSFAMTMLSWSVIEYHSKYQQLGELIHVEGIIKWGTDYFLNTFDSSADTIHDMVFQVGHEGTERYCWIRPEDIDYQRHADICFSECPDLAAEMAAALASASIVFSKNVAYSQKLIHGAKILYKYAESSMNTHTSSSWDELLWGGVWLYYATGDVSFLDRVTTLALADPSGVFSRDSGVFSWNTKLAGAQLLLTRLRLFLSPGYPSEEVLRKFYNQIGNVMCSYLPSFNKFNRTKGGLIQLNHGDPQPLQYAANAAFLAALYSDYLDASDTPGWSCGPNFYLTYVLRDFSRSQIDYILGKNPQNMSYVVGFGERYPKRVHHRGASIPKNRKESCKGGWKWRESSKENPNVIEGAMVAGPDGYDGFHVVRTNSNYTEPTLTGNAGLIAALVVLSGQKDNLDKNGIFSAIPPLFPVAPPPPAPWTP
ncbi:hypothetical protein BRARA_H00249 [Brassica rapa]|uniref:Endoglucanase n=2 Tax=Brassica campestris TaxID=3711 RepID=A0A397YEL4_BRACM|nr:hypothetical protein IGI04_029527 [Brassica rapa subsp. trilocularis]RID49449.1 hypothetical protein BRARA_H00249 [Brassica rapa]RID49450.1 hypothetical protein BRARA_H00249 [Brassica rapa]